MKKLRLFGRATLEDDSSLAASKPILVEGEGISHDREPLSTIGNGVEVLKAWNFLPGWPSWLRLDRPNRDCPEA